MKVYQHLVTLLILLITQSALGQVSITNAITGFEVNCSESIDSLGRYTKFGLHHLKTMNGFTDMQFSILANCANRNKGEVSVSGDTLVITETDVTVRQEVSYDFDSLGNKVKVITEVRESELVFCHCLFTYHYQFSKQLENLKILKYHNRVYPLVKPKN